MARVVTVNGREYRMLETADDITPDIERAIGDAVEWFDDSPTMGAEEFLDCLCQTYGESDGAMTGAPGFDLDSYDNAAARRIMRIARAIRKESREL